MSLTGIARDLSAWPLASTAAEQKTRRRQPGGPPVPPRSLLHRPDENAPHQTPRQHRPRPALSFPGKGPGRAPHCVRAGPQGALILPDSNADQCVAIEELVAVGDDRAPGDML